jgi:hypothetical protein
MIRVQGQTACTMISKERGKLDQEPSIMCVYISLLRGDSMFCGGTGNECI